jgi:ribose/xylose/arabinose/galactoside ABC-type transport system permease subunit
MRLGSKILLMIIDNIIWVLFLLLIVVGSILMPYFFTFRNMINVLYASVGLGLLVLAQATCLITGNFDLSIESTAGFAPAITVIFLLRLVPGINPITMILLTLIAGALIGLLNGFFIATVKVNAFLQTLSLLIIMRGLSLYLVPIPIHNLPQGYYFLGNARIANIFPIAIIVMLLIYVIFDLIFRNTPFGRSFFAVGGNLEAANLSGINTRFIITMAFVLSGTLAALGGLLIIGRMRAITNTVGEGMVMLTFAGAVLGGVRLQGGKGKVSGVLAGVLLLSLIDNILTLRGINPYIIYGVKGIILFIAIVSDQLKENARKKILISEEIFKFTSKGIKEKHV